MASLQVPALRLDLQASDHEPRLDRRRAGYDLPCLRVDDLADAADDEGPGCLPHQAVGDEVGAGVGAPRVHQRVDILDDEAARALGALAVLVGDDEVGDALRARGPLPAPRLEVLLRWQNLHILDVDGRDLGRVGLGSLRPGVLCLEGRSHDMARLNRLWGGFRRRLHGGRALPIAEKPAERAKKLCDHRLLSRVDHPPMVERLSLGRNASGARQTYPDGMRGAA